MNRTPRAVSGHAQPATRRNAARVRWCMACAAIAGLGLGGCRRGITRAEAQALALQPIAAPPPPPETDRKPALQHEIARLEDRKRQQAHIAGRLERQSRRLDRLFRVDAVSRGRRAAVDALAKAMELAPEGVVPSRITSIKNRWTFEIHTPEKPEDPEPRPSQLFAGALQLGVPQGSTVEYLRYWEGGPGAFILGFTHPAVVQRAVDAARAPLPEDRLPDHLRAEAPRPDGADDPGAPPAPTPPEVAPDAGPTEAPPPKADENAPLDEEAVLEARIAQLAPEVDEAALVADRDTLTAVEGELKELERRRLTRSADGTVRLAPADVERIAELAGITSARLTPRGPTRNGVLHAEAYELTGAGTLSAMAATFGELDAAGAVVGNVEILPAEADWAVRAEVHLLLR